MFLFFIIKNLLSCIKHHKSFQKSFAYMAYRSYSSYKMPDRKKMLTVLKDCEHLSRYWRVFPDMYFKMGMFSTCWSDMHQMETYIPQDAFTRFENKHKSKYNILIDDKIIFHDLMNYYHLPVPKVFFIYKNKKFYIDNIPVCDKSIDKVISEVVEDRIFVKRYTGGEASGVFVFKKKGDVFYDGDNPVSARYIREKYQDEKFFFEQKINQSILTKKFNPDSVNTIRVLATSHNGTIKLLSATARFGRKGSFIDNAACGGVSVAIDLETGTFADYGVLMYSPKKYYEHPYSSVKFSGNVIDCWDKVLEVANRTLELFPPYCTVGFDIAITETGPLVVELNTGPGMFLSQAGRTHGLAQLYNNIIIHK